MADMQVDKAGNNVSYEERLEDIKNRFGALYNAFQRLLLQSAFLSHQRPQRNQANHQPIHHFHHKGR